MLTNLAYSSLADDCHPLSYYNSEFGFKYSGGELCIDLGYQQGFVVKGEQITIRNSTATIKDAYGAFADSSSSFYVSSSLGKDQTLYFNEIKCTRETELFLNTYNNWKGSITLDVVVENGKQTKFVVQGMYVFNTNKAKVKLYIKGKSTMLFDESEYPGAVDFTATREFAKIGVITSQKEEDFAGKKDYEVTSKVDIQISGSGNTIPEKIIKVEQGIFGKDTPEAQVIDYYTGPNVSTDLIIIIVVVIIIVAIIAFCIVWFAVLKKHCCCYYCKKHEETQSNQTPVV